MIDVLFTLTTEPDAKFISDRTARRHELHLYIHGVHHLPSVNVGTEEEPVMSLPSSFISVKTKEQLESQKETKVVTRAIPSSR
jgi:hypothetical protein